MTFDEKKFDALKKKLQALHTEWCTLQKQQNEIDQRVEDTGIGLEREEFIEWYQREDKLRKLRRGIRDNYRKMEEMIPKPLDLDDIANQCALKVLAETHRRNAEEKKRAGINQCALRR